MSVLSRADQKKVIAIAIFQVCLGGLDLLGVISIGLLGALSVSGLNSQIPNSRVNSALGILHISEATFQTQTLVLGLVAVVLLLSRTVLSIFFTRRTMFFLSRRGAQISAKLISRLLSQSLLTVQARTTQETLYAVTTGVELIVLQILATGVVLVADVSLLLVMGIGLFVLDPATATGTILVFSAIGYSLYRFMNVRASELGAKRSQLNIASNEKIVEVFGSYRESVVRNRRDYYGREIGKLRFALADTAAEMNFLPYISKYIVESFVIFGTMLVGASQFILQNATNAVGTLAMFLAAGTRIAPAVLRAQQGSISIRGSLGQASPTLDLIQSLGDAPMTENVDDRVDTDHIDFKSEIHIKSVQFTYPGKNVPAISDVTLTIPAGHSVAIVGPSGAGKTTLIDILLGVLEPDFGEVLISGHPPKFAVSKWPGAVSYVPQDVVIAAGTIRENVSLGFPLQEANNGLVEGALRIAHLDKFVLELPKGVDTEVGERGAKISGGQRQRLGIARAMFTRPHLLVLDEATSSLDGETEATISEAIQAMRGLTTVVMIAHRLSTVRNADIVIYISAGKVLAQGTFEDVRALIPDFDYQARLMGL